MRDHAVPRHHLGSRLRQPPFGAIAANRLAGRRRVVSPQMPRERRLREDEARASDDHAEREPGEILSATASWAHPPLMFGLMFGPIVMPKPRRVTHKSRAKQVESAHDETLLGRVDRHLLCARREQRARAAARRHAADGQGAARQQRRQSLSRHPGLGAASRDGRGAAPTAWPSTGMASPCGRPTDARRGPPRAVSAPRRTRSTISTSQGRRSGALAAGCSCGRTASTSIEREMCG